MISEQAKNSFTRLFEEAARSRLVVDASHRCELVPLEPAASATLPGADLVVLTIVSIDFRLLLLLRFDEDEATRRYYLGDRGERSLSEAFMEVGNLCCGAINQQLVETFPDLGMSTPYVLAADCLGYLDELSPAWLRGWRITVDETIQLAATLCVCASVPLDFAASCAPAMESAGELELF
ncbi:hypothetical protein WKR88_02490 [Trinickia caryophylli]|uniref:Uncharacterized protein n=1 Tax=Trinickia caryophylli TaxID=28094 RepID=A0A1X7DWJ7_TRICW|nr:hypothetical protein [Trinickia caryophylli]PMS14260.1 hypothetical protein C0Z17_01685 [Trinickia caryophylli]TRX17959.1 hypothetical protein FNF07_06805 [Trinickia caryophylli]WQE11264.1 hypothetical protein U0034_16110 [Trinickia caryophylli]SMF22619.1 hypothetical protein SAMN06295900_104102 [Trinickia caryophylli]GLU32412.1 hypothetical protein Busp01_22540 [Trinickia caryophylli]